MGNIGCVVFAGIAFTKLFLLVQYSFFTQQCRKNAQSASEYQEHIVALEKIRQEYVKSEEHWAVLEERTGQKKNNIAHHGSEYRAQEGVTVCPWAQEKTFNLVNRDPSYLKQESLQYLKKHKLDHALQKRHFDSWRDYTDQLFERQQPKQARRGRRRRSQLLARSGIPLRIATSSTMI